LEESVGDFGRRSSVADAVDTFHALLNP